MPITSNDVLLKYSTQAGSAGHTQGGSAATSLGGRISTTQVSSNSVNNLFDDITGVQNAASRVDYRCVFVHNNHATLTLLNAIAYISAEVQGATTIAIAADSIAPSPIGQSSVQAATIANDTTPPNNLTFTSPTTRGAAISLGNIPAGYCKAFWIRRSAGNTTAVNNDGVTIRVEGDTAA